MAGLLFCSGQGRGERSGFYGPTVTIFATEGTPEPLIKNSMYGPGGAKAPLAGATALRLVELVAFTVSGKRSWLWLNPWVTEDSRIKVPRLMDPAFGVWIVNDCPYERREGAEVMLGRAARLPSALNK
jgi:hypothetical protein